MPDGFRPLRSLPRQFAQHILGAGVRGIDLDFLVHLFFRVLGYCRARVGFGEQQSSQTEMDAGQARILLQCRLIFLGRLVPFSLYFQGFGVELVRLVGRSCVLCQLLRGPGGKIRIGMDGQIQDIRVTCGKSRVRTCRKVSAASGWFRLMAQCTPLMDTFRLSSLSVTCARLFFKEGSASAQWPVSASLMACCATGELLGGSCSPGCAAQTGAMHGNKKPAELPDQAGACMV